MSFIIIKMLDKDLYESSEDSFYLIDGKEEEEKKTVNIDTISKLSIHRKLVL